MPSFNTISEVDSFEITNAVDQANRELSTRYDFKGVEAGFKLIESVVELTAQADIQLEQMLDILRSKLVNRSIDVRVIASTDTSSWNTRVATCRSRSRSMAARA